MSFNAFVISQSYARPTRLTTPKLRLPIEIALLPRYQPGSLPDPIIFDNDISRLPQNSHHNWIIHSRHIREDDRVAFVVGPERSDSGDTRSDLEVGLRDLYQYVTPLELERFEHAGLEEEYEREEAAAERRRKRKQLQMRFTIGRPGPVTDRLRRRNTGLLNTLLPKMKSQDNTGHQKRGRGRPKKALKPSFLGVHIYSPQKAIATVINPLSPQLSKTRENTLASSSSATTEMDDAKGPCFWVILVNRLLTILASETAIRQDSRASTSGSTIGASPRKPRAQYAMVTAALQPKEISESEMLPESEISEDELSLIPQTSKRRITAEIADSMSQKSTSETGGDERLEIDKEVVDDNMNEKSQNKRQGLNKEEHDKEILFTDELGRSPHQGKNNNVDIDVPAADLLAQFHGTKARRLKSPSPPRILTPPKVATKPPQAIENWFHPTIRAPSEKQGISESSVSGQMSQTSKQKLSTAKPHPLAPPTPFNVTPSSDLQARPKTPRINGVPTKVRSSSSVRRSMTPHFPPVRPPKPPFVTPTRIESKKHIRRTMTPHFPSARKRIFKSPRAPHIGGMFDGAESPIPQTRSHLSPSVRPHNHPALSQLQEPVPVVTPISIISDTSEEHRLLEEVEPSEPSEPTDITQAPPLTSPQNPILISSSSSSSEYYDTESEEQIAPSQHQGRRTSQASEEGWYSIVRR